MFWGMPQEIELLHTLAMLLGGYEAATLLGWSFGFLTLVGIFGYTKDHFGYNAAWVALACLLVGQSFSTSLAWGYVEWPAMLFATAMIIVMDDWLGNMKPHTIILAGILAGMALATKYTAGILLLAGMVIISSRFKSLGWQLTLKTLLTFGFSAVLIFSPWLIKNALATGNPVYPLLYPSGAMDQFRLDFYQKSSTTRPWLEMFLLPWQATVWGIEGKVGYSASIGPLLLGVSLMSVLGWKQRTKIEKTAILNVAFITGTCLIIWALASQAFGLLGQSRLYFSFFPAWAILGAAGFSAIEKLSVEKIRFGRITSVLVLLIFSFAVFETVVNTPYLPAKDVIFGHRSQEDYIKDNLGWYGPAMQAILDLPEGSKVLMLWETRSLYCLPKCDPDEVIDRWIHDARTFGTAGNILASWQEQGFTHLLLNLDGAAYFQKYETWDTNEDWEKFKILLEKLPPPINFGNSYSLYSLNSP
jgi:4-amino-4-deoxy-L-arabinose transferase-like glycosyltransferase